MSKAFAVTERLVALCDARDALSNAAAVPEFGTEQGLALLQDYWTKRAALVPAYKQALTAGAFTASKLDSYLRNDPAPRAVARLLTDAGVERESLQRRLVELETGAGGADLTVVCSLAEKVFRPAPALCDPDWQTLAPARTLDDLTFAWNGPPWRGTGEPAEGRMIGIRRGPSGRVTLRFEHCYRDRLGQWLWLPRRRGKSTRFRRAFAAG